MMIEGTAATVVIPSSFLVESSSNISLFKHINCVDLVNTDNEDDCKIASNPTSGVHLKDQKKMTSRVTGSPTSLIARTNGPIDDAAVKLTNGPVDICARLISGERIIDFCVSEPCPDKNCQNSFCICSVFNTKK